MWDNFVEIGWVQTTNRMRFRFSLTTKDGMKYIYIQHYYFLERGEYWKYDGKSIFIPIVLPMYGGKGWRYPLFDFLQMLKKCTKFAERIPLRDEDHAIYYNRETKRYENKGTAD
jgi:hypothetical protein